MSRLILLAGSMRPTSCSVSVCSEAANMARARGAHAEILSVLELDLPMYRPDGDLSAFGTGADSVLRLVEAYRRADVMLWCSPAYHGTVTGAFKNALDFAEFLAGDDPPYLQGKAVGLVAINDSTPFPAMRDSARELRAWVAPTHVAISSSEFDADRRLTSEKSRHRIQRLVEELLGHRRAGFK